MVRTGHLQDKSDLALCALCKLLLVEGGVAAHGHAPAGIRQLVHIAVPCHDLHFRIKTIQGLCLREEATSATQDDDAQRERLLQSHAGPLPPSMLSRVVFPEPEGPIKASTSPGWHVPDMSKRICVQKMAYIRHSNPMHTTMGTVQTVPSLQRHAGCMTTMHKI